VGHGDFVVIKEGRMHHDGGGPSRPEIVQNGLPHGVVLRGEYHKQVFKMDRSDLK
jgi:hypothetical protein